MNNDTTITPDCLTTLVREIEKDEKIGGVQPKIIRMDNPHQLDCVGGFLTSTGILYHYGFKKDPNDPKYNQKMEIFSMKGAAMLFRRNVLDEVGVFDEDFFAYYEETDLCHRVWLAGYTILYIPQAVIHHKIGGTSSAVSSNLFHFHSFKNRINSFIKNLSWVELLKVLPSHTFICILSSLAYPRLFTAIYKAIWWNIRHIKETLIKRKHVQSNIRKIQDKDLLPRLKRGVGLPYYYYFYKGLENYRD